MKKKPSNELLCSLQAVLCPCTEGGQIEGFTESLSERVITTFLSVNAALIKFFHHHTFIQTSQPFFVRATMGERQH